MIARVGLARRPVARRLLGCVMAGALSAALAGCVENAAELDARAGAPTRMTARPGVSPRAATVAFASIEGAPTAVAANFTQKLASEAESRDITTVVPASAKYLVRGYLTAFSAPGGASIGYVWDVFDSRKARVQRVEDQIAVKGASADPWALADDRVLASLAAKSADDLAAILTNMPEAQVASSSPSTTTTVASAGTSSGSLLPSSSAFR